MGAPMAKKTSSRRSLIVTVFRPLDAASHDGPFKKWARTDRVDTHRNLPPTWDVLMTSLPGTEAKVAALAMPPVVGASSSRGRFWIDPDDQRSRTRAGTRQHCKGARGYRHPRVTGDGGRFDGARKGRAKRSSVGGRCGRSSNGPGALFRGHWVRSSHCGALGNRQMS